MAAVSDYGARAVHISVQSTILGLACVVLRSYDAVIGKSVSFVCFDSIFRVLCGTELMYHFVYIISFLRLASSFNNLWLLHSATWRVAGT